MSGLMGGYTADTHPSPAPLLVTNTGYSHTSTVSTLNTCIVLCNHKQYQVISISVLPPNSHFFCFCRCFSGSQFELLLLSEYTIHGRVPWMFVDCDVQIISVSSLCVLMLLMLLMLLYLLFASHQSRNQLHCNPGHCPKQSQHAECIPTTLATLPSDHSPHNTGDPTFFPLSTCHTMPL